MGAGLGDVTGTRSSPGRRSIPMNNLLVLAGMSAARRGAMTVLAGSYRAVVAGTNGQVDVAVDPGLRALAVQSWYGGVHTVTCLISHRVTWNRGCGAETASAVRREIR
ncbi:hypothetical protein ACIBG8_02605 [Nonomuraea sp. NPDC050556]|uniref:hypothetical protein n=1 Tax=Nonomuraea sp. NPDC050556 TaxID=3364369 RepID=UPI0037B393B4